MELWKAIWHTAFDFFLVNFLMRNHGKKKIQKVS